MMLELKSLLGNWKSVRLKDKDRDREDSLDRKFSLFHPSKTDYVCIKKKIILYLKMYLH